MITATQAITSQYFSTQLWSVPFTGDLQAVVSEHSASVLGKELGPSSPEVIWCNLEGATIGIDQVRQLQEQLGFSSGKTRYVFILSAELLTLQAQHALLKLLEEPPANTQLVLVSSKPHVLLSTIRSRCSERRVGDVPSSSSTELAKLYATWKELSISQAITVAAEYKKKEVALPVLESLVQYLRTAVFPSTVEVKALQTLLADTELCLQALEQLSHNTNTQLVMESLLFRLNKHVSA
ncbi:MAG: hypothetical protein O2840_01890 [bacterium]|nr:hypothetical protein [bacterium]